jgi:thiosulfate/3-mercaptopyruvate sulfurtransferase
MTSALISPADAYELLQIKLGSAKLFDASYPPAQNIPVIGGAVVFDIDDIADPQNAMPHMLPSPHYFAQKMQQLGVTNNDTILIYDNAGIHMAAARAWWMMRVFGHDNVRIINGGLPAWMSANLPTVSAHTASLPTAQIFETHFRDHLVVNLNEMKHIVDTQSATIMDARPAERFLGIAPEPRAGMRAGHMPHAINVPTGSLIDAATHGLKTTPPLPAYDSQKRVVTTCGSGVTACVIALALFEAGKTDAAVYDGSWTEWGHADSHTQIVN